MTASPAPTLARAPRATVLGAYGHTGQFVVAELTRRGWTPILVGRDPARLAALHASYPAAEARTVDLAHPASLDRALASADIVLHCAGPFADTIPPVLAAALRARLPYLDIAAEQPAVAAAFAEHAAAALAADLIAIPAMAFYGGLADLLATAVLAGGAAPVDSIDLAIALDRWHPTRSTRLTGERNRGPRLRLVNHRLDYAALPPPRTWDFPPPFGRQDVEGVSLAEAITIARHLRPAELRVYLNAAPLRDLRNPHTPPPTRADASGRSAQTFLVDVRAHRGDHAVGRLVASGRDIYAFSATLLVEAAARVVAGRVRAGARGVLAAGEAFDTHELLGALAPVLVLSAE